MKFRCLFLLVCLLLISCSGGGGGGSKSAGSFTLLSTNVLPGQTWPINSPIEFRFSKPVNLDSVNFSSLAIIPAAPATPGAPVAGPAQGSFQLSSSSGGKTVIFQPFCPTDAENRNGGLMPGNSFGVVTYFVTANGSSSSLGETIRSADGDPLRDPFSFSFQTPTAPSSPFLDPKPESPPNIANLVELPLSLGPNHLVAPNSPIALVLDQPLLASTVNDDSILVEVEDPASGILARIPVNIFLSNNCDENGQALLTVVLRGVLPAASTVRFYLSSALRDLGGNSHFSDVLFHEAIVDTPSISPERDAVLERFDVAENPDLSAPFLVPFARAEGDGLLNSAELFPGTANEIEIEIGPGTLNGAQVTFSTDGAALRDRFGAEVFFPDGVIDVAKFHLKAPAPGGNSQLRGIGSRPLVIRARKQLIVEQGAKILVEGRQGEDVVGIGIANFPSLGGNAVCGGGRGGNGSPLTDRSDPKGEDGFGPFQISNGGGQGGHSAYAHLATTNARPGGGGGGNWGVSEYKDGAWQYFCYSTTGCASTNCQTSCPVTTCFPPTGTQFLRPSRGEAGSNGNKCPLPLPSPPDLQCNINVGVTPAFQWNVCQRDAVTGDCWAKGGAVGPSVFVDNNIENNFWGRKPLGEQVESGELLTPLGGQGGGAGGDNVPGGSFPSGSIFAANDFRGGAGGAGGGILILQSLGQIEIYGLLNANGGDGGAPESNNGDDLVAAGGGGGAGGMIVLESATGVLLGQTASLTAEGGDRGPGSGLLPNSVGASGDYCFSNITAGKGGAGGLGLIQIHVPFDHSQMTSCADRLQPRIASGALSVITNTGTQQISCEKDVLLRQRSRPSPHVLIPGFGPRSAYRSQWHYLGAGFDGGKPEFEFGGIDTTSGTVLKGAELVTFHSGQGGVISASANAVVLENAALAELVRSEPLSLIADRFKPNPQAGLFTIENVTVAGNRVSLWTDPSDGAMGNISNWTIYRRFFQATSNGVAATLSENASFQILFEGANAIAPGSTLPNPASVVGPTANILELTGKELLRFEIHFNANVNQETLGNFLPMPGTQFLKIPFSF